MGVGVIGNTYVLLFPPYCDPNTYLQPTPDNNTCSDTCPEGWWANTVSRICVICQKESTNTECTACRGAKWRDLTTDICEPCISECAECIDGSVCQVCAPDYYMGPSNSSCVTACPLRYYEDLITTRCNACHAACEECEGPTINECSSCANGHFLLHGTTMCSRSCTRDTYQDEDTNKCLSSEQLNDLISNEQDSFDLSQSECSNCSDAGKCEYSSQYKQKRCMCKSGRVGPNCANTQAELDKVLEKKLALIDAAQMEADSKLATSEDLETISSFLSNTTQERILTNTTVLQKSIQTAQSIADRILREENIVSEVKEQVFVFLLNVATQSLAALFENDCLFNSDTTRTMYNESISLMQSVARANLKRVVANSTSAKMIENDVHKCCYSTTA